MEYGLVITIISAVAAISSAVAAISNAHTSKRSLKTSTESMKTNQEYKRIEYANNAVQSLLQRQAELAACADDEDRYAVARSVLLGTFEWYAFLVNNGTIIDKEIHKFFNDSWTTGLDIIYNSELEHSDNPDILYPEIKIYLKSQNLN